MQAGFLLPDPDWSQVVEDRGERTSVRLRALEAWAEASPSEAGHALQRALEDPDPHLPSALAARCPDTHLSDGVLPPEAYRAHPDNSAALATIRWVLGGRSQRAAILEDLAQATGPGSHRHLPVLLRAPDAEIAAAARAVRERVPKDQGGRLSLAQAQGELSLAGSRRLESRPRDGLPVTEQILRSAKAPREPARRASLASAPDGVP